MKQFPKAPTKAKPTLINGLLYVSGDEYLELLTYTNLLADKIMDLQKDITRFLIEMLNDTGAQLVSSESDLYRDYECMGCEKMYRAMDTPDQCINCHSVSFVEVYRYLKKKDGGTNP